MTRERWGLVYCSVLLAPGTALAHSPIKDIGAFYGGLLHPLFIPAHALLLGALGLMLGQQAPAENKIPLLLFLTCAVAGLAIAGYSSGGEFEAVQLLGSAVIGLLVAIQPTMPVFLRAAGAAAAGLLVGMDSGQTELASAALFASLVGTWLGMCVLLLCTMGAADYLKEKPWQKIGVRIIGSWIAASALLVLSLSFATPGPL
jgi:hydrogenase/urease accessory protein HupE